MRSTDSARRGQSGQSLVEAMVASALLGIVAVVALTTMDTATFGAKRGIREAWAQCSVRQLANAIEGSAWSTSYGSQDPTNIRVFVSPPSGSAVTAIQTVNVTARDPDSGQLLYQVSFLRVKDLQGADQLDAVALSSLVSGCPAP